MSPLFCWQQPDDSLPPSSGCITSASPSTQEAQFTASWMLTHPLGHSLLSPNQHDYVGGETFSINPKFVNIFVFRFYICMLIPVFTGPILSNFSHGCSTSQGISTVNRWYRWQQGPTTHKLLAERTQRSELNAKSGGTH